MSCVTTVPVETSLEDQLGLIVIKNESKDQHYINLGFECEPERDASYKKRTEKLIGQKVLVVFYDLNEKEIAQSWMIVNPRIMLYGPVSSEAFKNTAIIEIQVRNKTVSVLRERLDAPIILPNSICDKN